MSSHEQRELLKKLFNNLEDRPLEPNHPFYYPFLEQTDDDPIAELAGRISFSQSQSVNLFTGQRGSGKSTEFRRLRKMLIEDDCEVFLLDMREYMNLTTPVEISDFLISIMAALSEEVEERFKKSPHRRSYLERLTDFLMQEVKIEEIETSLIKDVVGVKASLKDDPSFKQRLQQGLKGHVARIVKDAHQFAREIVELIRKETRDNGKKVVLLVDSVEQLRGVGADGANEVYKSVENLFSGHADSLQMPMLHIVYTIPPYLTPLAPGLGRQLGANLGCTLPCIHVQKRSDHQPDPDGLAIMRTLLQKRCPEGGQNIFIDERLNKLAEASGGDLRDFFRLIRDSLVKASSKSGNICPISDAVIEQTLNHSRREMLPIAREDKEWLIKIDASKKAELETMDKLPTLARFFDTKLVLNYRNGDDWYDVHPLLRDEIRS
jgi:energy-coupling factor transporter ATP-binding protein EcfA2